MFPRDIVVYLEQDDGAGAGRLRFAANLAKRWAAHLIAVFVVRPLSLDSHAGFALGGALTAMLREHEAKKTTAIERMRGHFEQLTRQRSFTAEWRIWEQQHYESLMLHARHAGLSVQGPSRRQLRRTTVMGLAERLVFASGRPCLLLPEHWRADRLPNRIVVGWNGGREAARAIADSLPLLATAAEVHLLVMTESAPHGLLGPDPGTDMAAHLARHGVPVLLEQHANGDAGDVLLARSAQIGADLLVLGAKGRFDAGDFLFGSTTHRVLGSAGLPLLLSS